MSVPTLPTALVPLLRVSDGAASSFQYPYIQFENVMTKRVISPRLFLLLLPWVLLPAALRADDAAEIVHRWNWHITDIMVDEIRTPCNISRVYAYLNIAAYEAARPGFSGFRSLAGQVNGLPDVPQRAAGAVYDPRVSVVAAFKTIGDALTFTPVRVDSMYDADMATFKASGLAADVIERSRAYGESVALRLLQRSKTDGYIRNIARARYVIPKGPGLWEPTPPDFADPVDPYWRDVMPFALKKPNQYPPDPPVKFSAKPGSAFYKQAMEVYTIKKNLNDTQKLIASFWDCNPIHSFHMGHINFTTRQISPAGHWISITKIACRARNVGMMESLEAYALVSTSIADAFLGCWTEKYRSNGIRPVTYIRRYIDSTWLPEIQTPPFPEHSSGHSTISAAAGTMLTHLFGPMRFDDNTEVYLGMPVRSFPDFMTAAREAAMSRLWGGIHYRHGNEAGTKNGQKIGDHVRRTLQTRL